MHCAIIPWHNDAPHLKPQYIPPGCGATKRKLSIFGHFVARRIAEVPIALKADVAIIAACAATIVKVTTGAECRPSNRRQGGSQKGDAPCEDEFLAKRHGAA